MRFLVMALMFTLWQSDAARAKGRVPSVARQHLVKQMKELDQFLVKQMLGGMNVEAGAGVIIGIDLGTTNSAVSIYESDAANIVQIGADKRTLPSVVSLTAGKEGVGDVALARRSTDPESTIFSIKRLMGKKLAEVDQAIVDSLPFDVIADADGWAVVKVGDKTYTPVEISARILSKLKQIVEAQGYEIEGAVITIPAYFDDAQRQATEDAGKIAGLEVKRLVAEPTAAALAHGFEHGKIAVYDLGGGTFDISIVNMDDLGEGKYAAEVVGTEGNSTLGGDNFDEKIIEHFLQGIKEETDMDVSSDVSAIAILRDEAKKVKELLSESENIDINIPFVAFNQSTGRPVAFNSTLSRARFDEMIRDLVDETIALTKSALQEADTTADDIDAVVMVGGSSRVPLVEEQVTELFAADKVSKRDNPDEVVAIGAGIQAGVLSGKVGGLVLLDVTPFSLGVELKDGLVSVVLEKNSKIPIEKTQVGYRTTEDNQTEIDVIVLQGESKVAAGNKEIGRFKLTGILPAKASDTSFELTFDLDASGLLKVTAKDSNTKKEASIAIKSSSSLSDAEIEELRRNEEAYAEQAEHLVKLGEQISELDRLVLSMEKVLKDSSDKLDENNRTSLQSGISGAKSAIKEASAKRDAGDYEQASQIITSAKDAFEPQAHEVSETIYGEGKTEQE